MAFGTPVVGTTAYSASGGTSVSPAYPSGIQSTDQLILVVGQKPSTANNGTVTTPTGWTLQDSLTAAGGYGTTLGADTGNTNLRIYTKNTVTTGQTGTQAVTLGANGVSWAFIVRVPTSGGAITYGVADGQRTTTPTSPMSIALTNGASATNFQAGDLAFWAMCIPTDVTTPSQFSNQSISASGVTFNTAVELNEPDSTTGNDIGGYSAWATVASGSSTTAPTVTATLAGTLTNVRGPVVLLRLTEAAPSELTGNLDATETGIDTFTSNGDVHVKGALTVSETGNDTFAASGSVSFVVRQGSLAATETGTDTLSSTGKVVVRGSLSVSETGSDAFASTGSAKKTSTGSLSVTEVGVDTLASTGRVVVKATSVSLTETSSDSLVAVGKVIIKSSSVSLTEDGTDIKEAIGKVLIKGPFSSLEFGTDGFSAVGLLTTSISGTFAATESGGGVPFGGVSAVMKYWNGSSWQVLYKDPVIYT